LEDVGDQYPDLIRELSGHPWPDLQENMACNGRPPLKPADHFFLTIPTYQKRFDLFSTCSHPPSKMIIGVLWNENLEHLPGG
jgi:hypothetical protein